MNRTYTYVILPLTDAAYGEIRHKLLEAGYAQALHRDGDEEVIDMHGIAVQAIPRKEMAPEGSVVAGIYMDRTLNDFVRGCETYILEESRKLAPDTHLLSLLCDAVRLTREMEQLATGPIHVPSVWEAPHP